MRVRVTATVVAAVVGVALALLGTTPANAAWEVGAAPDGFEVGATPDGWEVHPKPDGVIW